MPNKTKKEEIYYCFAYWGDAMTPERFWTMRFTNALEAKGGVLVTLTRGVPESEAIARLKGCKLVNEIIGDIRKK